MRLNVGDAVEVRITGHGYHHPYPGYAGPSKRVGVVVYAGSRYAVLDYGPYREAFHWDDLHERIRAAR